MILFTIVCVFFIIVADFFIMKNDRENWAKRKLLDHQVRDIIKQFAENTEEV